MERKLRGEKEMSKDEIEFKMLCDCIGSGRFAKMASGALGIFIK